MAATSGSGKNGIHRAITNVSGSDSFGFSVADGVGGVLANQSFDINVMAVNDAPSGTNKVVTSNEDTAYTLSAGDFGFSDVDVGDSLSAVRIDSLPVAGNLTLGGGAVTAGQVIAAASIGALTFTPAVNANGANYAALNFSVRDQSAAFAASPSTLTFNVTAVNDAPTAANKLLTTNEDTAYTMSAADFGFGDVDVGDSMSGVRIDSLPVAGSLTLGGVAVTAGQVIATVNLGSLTFTPAANANGTNYASFNFSVKDQAGAFDVSPNTLSFNVTAVNDAPTGSDKLLTTNEDTPYSLSAADFGFADVDVGDSLSGVRIDSLPTAGSLTLGGVAVTGGQVITAASLGSLTFTPEANASGVNYASFSFSVKDQAGAFDASPNTLSFNVTAVNDAPTGADKLVTTNEDTPYSLSAADFDFADVDVGDSISGVRIDSLPTAGSLTLGGVAVTAGQVIATVNLGGLTFTPAANANGANCASLDFSVKDSAGAFAASPNTLSFDVTPVNDAPTVAMALLDQSAAEDASWSYVIPGNTFADVDAGDTLTYAASLGDGSSLPSWVRFNGATQTFSGTPTNSDVGGLSLKVTATDNAGASVSGSFNLTVANTNDAPNGADKVVTTNEDTAYTLSAADFGFSDVDVGDSMSGVRIDSLPTAGSLTLGGVAVTAGQVIATVNLGGLTFTPAANANGANCTSFDFSVKDQSGAFAVSPNTLSFNVTAVNDAPTGANKVLTTNEDTAYTLTSADFGFIDVDVGDTLSGVRIDSLPAAGSLTLGGVSVTAGQVIAAASLGSLTFTPAANANGTNCASLNFSVKDQAGSFAAGPSTLSFDVTPVNDAPAGTNKVLTTNEDTAYTLSAADFGFTDVDVGDSMSGVRIDGLPAAGSLTLRGVAVTAGQVIAAASIASLTFIPAANANGANLASLNFSVKDQAGSLAAVPSTLSFNVTPVNDAPTVALALLNQSAQENSVWTYVVPGNTFADVDVGDTLTYSAALADGTALPGWLSFNAATHSFSGTPPHSAVGSVSLSITASDSAGASVGSNFALSVAPAAGVVITGDGGNNNIVGSAGDDRLDGGAGNDTVNGGAGNDILTGGSGVDLVQGGAGNDTLLTSTDGIWSANFACRNSGSPGNAGSGQMVSITGATRNYDVFDGGTGSDTIRGGAGNDIIVLDDSYSASPNGYSPRFVGVERIEGGGGNDVIDLTSPNFAYGDVTLDGGDGNDTLWSSSGNDLLLGGAGNDGLDGGAGNDVLQGGAGNDTLLDSLGNNVLDGGQGNDVLTDGNGASWLAGGAGSDTLNLGKGADVVAFNRGDGADTLLFGAEAANDVLSLGHGIQYADLRLRKSGNNLIVDLGQGDSLTLQNWYGATPVKTVSQLQIIGAAGGYQPNDPSNPAGQPVEVFDFAKLVQNFDAAVAQNASNASGWAAMNKLLDAHLSGSSTQALGGDLSFQYANTGTLAGIGLMAAQSSVAAGSTQWQGVKPRAQVELGSIWLS